MRPGLLVMAQLLDAVTLALFYLLPHPASLSEQNPLVAMLLALGGIQLVVLVKVGAAALAARRARRYPSLSLRWRVALSAALVAATLSGVIGAGANTAAIVVAITGDGLHL
jgi:hypothetical protein